MPMSTNDAPGSAGRTSKTPPADPSPDPVASSAPLRPGAESSDPAVHQLLAERQTAAQNGDKAAGQAATDALAALGFR